MFIELWVLGEIITGELNYALILYLIEAFAALILHLEQKSGSRECNCEWLYHVCYKRTTVVSRYFLFQFYQMSPKELSRYLQTSKLYCLSRKNKTKTLKTHIFREQNCDMRVATLPPEAKLEDSSLKFCPWTHV